MPPYRAILLALAAVPALAGCLADEPVVTSTPLRLPDPGSGDDSNETAAPGPHVVTATYAGGIAGVGGPGGYLRIGGENRHEFPLAGNETALLVEVAWSTADALDLVVEVPRETCQDADPAGLTQTCDDPPWDADGASPARILVTEPERLALAGTWSLAMWARSSPAEVPFTAYVTAFHGGVPEEAWTAIDDG